MKNRGEPMGRGRKYRFLPRGTYGERPQVPYFSTGTLWGQAASTVFYHRDPIERGHKYRILPRGPYGEGQAPIPPVAPLAASTVFYHPDLMGTGRKYRILPRGPYGGLQKHTS